MKSILIKPTEIECCWEKEDACFVKTTSNKIWICEKCIDGKHLMNFILENESKTIIKLPLKSR